MGHWYLKAMRVRAALRHKLQTAHSIDAFYDVLTEVEQTGPAIGTKDGVLPDMHVPVPSGPVERW